MIEYGKAFTIRNIEYDFPNVVTRPETVKFYRAFPLPILKKIEFAIGTEEFIEKYIRASNSNILVHFIEPIRIEPSDRAIATDMIPSGLKHKYIVTRFINLAFLYATGNAFVLKDWTGTFFQVTSDGEERKYRKMASWSLKELDVGNVRFDVADEDDKKHLVAYEILDEIGRKPDGYYI